MTNNRFRPDFMSDCTGPEIIAGWVMLAVHMIVFPLLLGVIQQTFLPDWSAVEANALYYGISFLLCALLFWKLLRREFDHLCDRPLHCLKGLLIGYALWYGLGMLVTSLLMTVGFDTTTPNDQAVDMMAAEGYQLTMVMSVIGAPIVEEILFRGIVFQSLRSKNRALAYVASLLLFGVYHVWQFVYITGDFTYLLHIIQYIPITFALTWCYEYSGSLWTAIVFHASNNYLALTLMQYL